MSEIKDRQDAASDIDPIVAALADDSLAAAAVEGFDEAAEPADREAEPTEAAELPALETEAEWLAADGLARAAAAHLDRGRLPRLGGRAALYRVRRIARAGVAAAPERVPVGLCQRRVRCVGHRIDDGAGR